MLDNPFSEEIFPKIQFKLPLAQLQAVSSHPIACYLVKETNTHLATTSFQVLDKQGKLTSDHDINIRVIQTPQHIGLYNVHKGHILSC